jgi:hypothetical protein
MLADSFGICKYKLIYDHVVLITLKISQFADVAARDLLMVLAEGRNARKIDSAFRE